MLSFLATLDKVDIVYSFFCLFNYRYVTDIGYSFAKSLLFYLHIVIYNVYM